MYTFTTGSPVAHATHCWEEWHAYLTDELPEDVSLDASGICCHTCSTIVIDTPEPYRPEGDDAEADAYFMALSAVTGEPCC